MPWLDEEPEWDEEDENEQERLLRLALALGLRVCDELDEPYVE